MENRNRVLVLDFGSQYTHLLARRIRELGVFSQIRLPTVSLKELQNCSGIILSGGPASVYEKSAPKFNEKIFKAKVPILGLCYGEHLLAHFFGGKILMGKRKEYGSATLTVSKKEKLFEGLSKKQVVWMSHGDKVKTLPDGFEKIASTTDCLNAAIFEPKKDLYGLQFHPEVTHTKNGMKILSNFIFKICKCKKNWSPKNFLQEKIEKIRKTTGEKKIFFLASGGVDSTVLLGLFSKAIGEEKIFALHVDTGFMRKNESMQVKKALNKLGLKNFKVIDASELFFNALKNVVEPEAKRKIIGKLFVEIANKETSKLKWGKSEWLLGQGTIYPDTIETQGSKHSSKIKTHHNQVELIKKLSREGRVIEPLKDLYKDEVRVLGELLGLPKELVWRQPFPGPGLAIRALCSKGIAEDTKKIEERAEKIAHKFGFSAKILPVKAVGVQGDFRTYRFVCALSGKLDWKKLEEVSTRITNEVKEINRVVFTLFPKKIETIKLLKTSLTRKRIELLQEADAVAMNAIQKHGLVKKIWQFPVVLLPVQINGAGEGIVLRPVFSLEAMTAKFATLPKKTLKQITEKTIKLRGIGSLFFDVTHKPPATIEWE